MKKVFSLVLLAMIFFVSNVSAEIKIYEDVGEFLLADKSLDFAKNQAKLNGIRNIAEQIFVKIEGETEVKNSELIRDEVISKSESLMKILDVKYKIESVDEEILIKAFVTAEIDTEEIEQIIKKFEAN